MQAGDLRCKVTIKKPDAAKNELGEDIQDGLVTVKENVPAQIIPTTGSNPGMQGDVDATEVTHKIRIRAGVVELKPDYVIIYNDQRFDVRWWQPVYKNERYMEIMTVLEVNV